MNVKLKIQFDVIYRQHPTLNAFYKFINIFFLWVNLHYYMALLMIFHLATCLLINTLISIPELPEQINLQ